MNDKKKTALQVSALCNGTVIDHIPSDKVFSVVNLLGLNNIHKPITVGANLNSKKMGSKGIIKIADHYFTDSEVNKLSLIAPNIVLSTIKNYEVAGKRKISMPDEIKGIVKCANPKCITNHEPMATRFTVVDKVNGILRCNYCNKEISIEEIKLL